MAIRLARYIFPGFYKKYDAAYYAWWYRNIGHQKYGLRLDDMWNSEVPDVGVAISRLTEDENNLRQWRLKRSLDVSMKRRILPEDLWTTPEQDVRYILPLVKQAREERLEREAWEKL